MQHFLFGSILHFEPSSYTSEGSNDDKVQAQAHLEHYHDANNPNCCPRIPSALSVPRANRIPLPLD